MAAATLVALAALLGAAGGAGAPGPVAAAPSVVSPAAPAAPSWLPAPAHPGAMSSLSLVDEGEVLVAELWVQALTLLEMPEPLPHLSDAPDKSRAQASGSNVQWRRHEARSHLRSGSCAVLRAASAAAALSAGFATGSFAILGAGPSGASSSTVSVSSVAGRGVASGSGLAVSSCSGRDESSGCADASATVACSSGFAASGSGSGSGGRAGRLVGAGAPTEARGCNGSVSGEVDSVTCWSVRVSASSGWSRTARVAVWRSGSGSSS